MKRLTPLLFTLPFWAVALYGLGLPLIFAGRRGEYFGLFGIQDLYLGVPALIAGLALTLFLLLPRGARRKAAGPLLVVPFATIIAVLAFDMFYVFGVCGAGTPNRWLDAAHVSRLDNVPDDELGFVRKPYSEFEGPVRGIDRVVHYRTDGDGFRNQDGIEQAEIVFIGDSYTEAAQVDDADTFVQRVGEASGKSVINLGRGAYGPQAEKIVLDRWGFGYQPKVVVWQLFDGNDLLDAEEYADWKADPNANLTGLRQRYFANSFVTALLAGAKHSKQNDFAEFTKLDGTVDRRTMRYPWRPDQISLREQGWAEIAATLREGAAACKERGVELVVLFVPVALRVYQDRVSFPEQKYRDKFLPGVEPDVTPRDFGTALTALCDELGLPLVDVYPVFAADAKQHDDIYIPRDEHLDIHGHALVTESLLPYLE